MRFKQSLKVVMEKSDELLGWPELHRNQQLAASNQASHSRATIMVHNLIACQS
jgi:hypothetical protein